MQINPSIATLFAAFIAAIVSLVVTVLAKEQKTSEFRQQWIDGLRADMADFHGTVTTFIFARNTVAPRSNEEQKKFFENHHELGKKMAELEARVRLRLNAIEHWEFEQKIAEYLRFLANHQTLSLRTKEFLEIQESYIVLGQVLLKKEWERVKRGEKAFRLVRGGAMLVAGGLFSALILYGLHSISV